jgi:hypothetical protein
VIPPQASWAIHHSCSVVPITCLYVIREIPAGGRATMLRDYPILSLTTQVAPAEPLTSRNTRQSQRPGW